MGVIQGVATVPGTAEGVLLVSDEPMSFWGGYDAATGDLIDQHHPLCGQNACGRVLGVPFTIGSSTTAAVFLQAIRDGTAPAAIITVGADSFLALASIVAEEMYGKTVPIVSVSAGDYEKLSSGEQVRISETGEVSPVEPSP